jgi:hypothetical protein
MESIDNKYSFEGFTDFWVTRDGLQLRRRGEVHKVALFHVRIQRELQLYSYAFVVQRRKSKTQLLQRRPFHRRLRISHSSTPTPPPPSLLHIHASTTIAVAHDGRPRGRHYEREWTA